MKVRKLKGKYTVRYLSERINGRINSSTADIVTLDIIKYQM